MHPLAQRLLSQIHRQELLRAGDRVGVAVSGGIDSVALLRLLLELRAELGIVLSVVHFNHKLRGDESDADERFVANLAREHDLEIFSDSDDVAQHAAAEKLSLEAAARELRYGFFRHLIREGSVEPRGPESQLDKIVTGHTLDDQAETVLMRLIRGAGLKGLGAIHPRIAVDDDEGELCGEIVRPLLAFRRRELESFLKDAGQSWRDDATNDEAKFTRNRIRQLLVPLLEKEFNPSVAGNLAELAEIARGEEDYWDNEVAGWLGTAVHWSEPEWAHSAKAASLLVQIGSAKPADDPVDELRSKIEKAPWAVMNASVDRVWLLGEPIAVQRRVVKAIGEQAGVPLEFKHVEETVRFAAEPGGSGKKLCLPLGWTVEQQPEALNFITPDLREPEQTRDYEYELPVAVPITVSEAGSTIELRRVPATAASGYNPDHLLDADSLPGPLRVRNWRAGDRFWPGHTKSPKKIKELLQDRHVAQPERKLWPVVVSGDQVVWVRGFPSPASLRAKPGHEAVMIVETLGNDTHS